VTPFAYSTAVDQRAAIEHVRRRPATAYIAGGTDLLQLLEERVVTPSEIVDINELPLSSIAFELDGVRIGALARLADVADNPEIAEHFPALAQALLETASPQVRNMATMGGNLLQRTRCLYFRDTATPCNKRVPGSGCPAQDGENRINAILGGSSHCIAVHPSDLAVALTVLDAEVVVSGASGERTVAVDDLYRLPEDTPHRETVLEPGELITAIWIPLGSAGLRSRYLKVRDRTSFEFALTSCAVAIGLKSDTVFEARIAVGGVATKPWRLRHVEEALVGRKLDAGTIGEVAALAAEGARPRGRNMFKVRLLERTVARTLALIGAEL
jgi:xanthine dehydrogenase YagS FAD-binding subunit